MDFESIKKNFMNAFSQLSALRLIVSSPSEKIADLPALYVLIAALIAPYLCVALLILGFLTKHAARFEKDASRA